MPPRLRRSVRVLPALLALSILSACDTIAARQRANEGASLYKKGRFREAAERFDEAARLDPTIPELALNQGFSALSILQKGAAGAEREQAGNAAIAAFQRYVELRPADARGRQYLVETYVETRRWADAEAYFRPAAEGTPPSIEAITVLAHLASKLGRIADAVEWYRRRAELQPANVEAHLGLGVLIWDHLRAQPQVAGAVRLQLADTGIGALERAMTLSPDAAEPVAYVNLLYRERALGHGDCNAPPAMGTATATTAECLTERASDLAKADGYLLQAQRRLAAAAAAAGAH